MRVSIITNDKYLYRALQLELSDVAFVSDKLDEGSELVIFDLDAGIELPDIALNTVLLSRHNTPGALPLPLPRGSLRTLIEGHDKKPQLSISKDGKCAFLKGKTIKLTSHESALLSLLLDGKGKFTTREEISKKVWGDASDGLINIYIHYLREKLENDGEKIIISSRKYGYKINPAYIEVKSNVANEIE